MRATRALLLLFLTLAGCSDGETPTPAGLGLPWQVEMSSQGSTRVFGLTLGESRFADAESTLGARYTLALFGAKTEAPQLEAFYREVAVGGLTGRMVLNLTLPEEDLRAMRDRSPDERAQTRMVSRGLSAVA